MRQFESTQRIAFRIDPKYADPYDERGLAKEKLGKLKDASKDYEEAAQLDPKFAEIHKKRDRERCPPHKSCYAIEAIQGRVLNINWEKQTSITPDRTGSYKLHLRNDLGEDIPKVIFDIILPDGVIVRVLSSNQGRVHLEKIPNGNCKEVEVFQ